jgi:hypothetical protein
LSIDRSMPKSNTKKKDAFLETIADILRSENEREYGAFLSDEDRADIKQLSNEMALEAIEGRYALPETPQDTITIETVSLLDVLPDQSRAAIALKSTLFPLTTNALKQLLRVLKPNGTLKII